MSYQNKEIIFMFLLFFIIIIDMYNFKNIKNPIDKLYLCYFYNNNNKLKYWYHFYGMFFLILCLTIFLFNYISLYILLLLIINIFIDKIFVRNLINIINKKLNNKKEEYQKVINTIYEILYNNNVNKNKKIKNSTFIMFINYYIIFFITLLENYYFIINKILS